MSDGLVLFEVIGAGGWITLNRPAALNALNTEMVSDITQQLKVWESDDRIEFVVIQGLGRAFCAGGDLRMVYQAEKNAQAKLATEFFRIEYALNLLIHNYSKPYIALLHGITMGGGMGISIHGTYRVVTEDTVMAMPETAIGFFPDVGAAWYLNRCPGKIGLYLGLTSERIGAADAIYTGLATHHIPTARMQDLTETLKGASYNELVGILEKHHERPHGESVLQERQSLIDGYFSKDTLEDIFMSLSKSGSDFAKATLQVLRQRSPLSLRTTFSHFKAMADRPIEDVLAADLALALQWEGAAEFMEGIRAAVIDKDQQPKWISEAVQY